MENEYKPCKYKSSCAICDANVGRPVDKVVYDYPNLADFRFGDMVKAVCESCLRYNLQGRRMSVTIKSWDSVWGK